MLVRNVEYASVGGSALHLDASVPEGGGLHPAAVIVHGGGWIRGDRAYNVAPLFTPLSDAGFAWFSISYRLATSFFDAGDAVADVVAAVRFVRSQAKKFHVDESRIALVGESAGGHLASMAALSEPGLAAAVVALYAPFDLEELALESPLIPAQMRQYVEASGMREFVLERLRALSPVRYVAPGAPPFLFIHGTADAVVPYRQSVRMKEALDAAGVESELCAVEGRGHGMRYWSERHGCLRNMVDWLQRRMPGA